MTIAMSEHCRSEQHDARKDADPADQVPTGLPAVPGAGLPGDGLTVGGAFTGADVYVGADVVVSHDVVEPAVPAADTPATAEDRPCEVLQGIDGPVYFLLGGLLYVVHEVLGRWLEPERDRRVAARGSGPDIDAEVEHWLVTASLGRFGNPEVFRLKCRPAPPAIGPTHWTVRPERGRRR